MPHCWCVAVYIKHAQFPECITPIGWGAVLACVLAFIVGAHKFAQWTKDPDTQVLLPLHSRDRLRESQYNSSNNIRLTEKGPAAYMASVNMHCNEQALKTTHADCESI